MREADETPQQNGRDGLLMATIALIDDRTVHQIQSGQVIVDLCSVVKELVENSLDAGATSIEVRFKNQGLNSIEVQDNGSGITPENYETVALKHHTSKLSTYSDLGTLNTFGFRGEALSSLCALSHFTVVTCLAPDAPKGTKLEFATSGKLKDTSVVAAQKGTTVSVEELFKTLPVRRRELERNIKREWGRVTGVLQQYACIQTGVKFTVTQQPTKGKKNTLFSTKGNPSTRENILNVFGAKTLTALIALDLNLKLQPTSGQKWTTQEEEGSKIIRIVGHISRPAYGEGRQTPDRQMFCVNSRPCGLPQVAKAFNEVYKSYNSSQSPFIFANIEMDTHMYDVNVSPDKRTILLHDQTHMLEHLKTSLTELFESQNYTVPISQFPAQKLPSYRQLTISRENTRQSELSHAREPRSEANSNNAAHDSEEDGSLRKALNQSYSHNFSTDQNQNGEVVSLIDTWGKNKTGSRREQQDTGPEHIESLSKDKLKLIKKSSMESTEVEDEVDDDTLQDTADVSETGVLNDRPQDVEALPQPTPEIDEEQQQQSIIDSDIIAGSQASITEELIQALPSPAKHKVTNIGPPSTDRRVRMRPATIATITIGDHTVTTEIGRTLPKRSPLGRSTGSEPKPSVSTFGNRLSKRFAAPGASQSNTLNGLESELTDFQSSAEEEESLVELEEQRAEDEGDVLESEEDDAVEPATAIKQHENIQSAQPSRRGSPSASDRDYIDEDEKKAREDAKVQDMIASLEQEAAHSNVDSAKRSQLLNKGGLRRKEATTHLLQTIKTSAATIDTQLSTLENALRSYDAAAQGIEGEDDALATATAEERLSLTIHKSDFANMKIIGQFNLGFILASRTSSPLSAGATANDDDLFIIDQHASDEKYNFERLQATTVVQSQRLVTPKTLDLSAVEEEIVMENLPALEHNGFVVRIDTTGAAPVGHRCQLISLPLSRETTFSLSDLDELIALLAEYPTGGSTARPPRPARVRKMFAMRACRSSVMIGRTLTPKQMAVLVRHMGELDKPWNCPHGRPTMRHLCGLRAWDESGWREGDGGFADGEEDVVGRAPTDWAAYVRRERE